MCERVYQYSIELEWYFLKMFDMTGKMIRFLWSSLAKFNYYEGDCILVSFFFFRNLTLYMIIRYNSWEMGYVLKPQTRTDDRFKKSILKQVRNFSKNI